MTTLEDHWYVGQTRSGLGPWAEKNLTNQPEFVYEVYAPRILGEDGRTGENLFTRYVMIRMVPTREAFSCVNSTRGMNKLLPLHSETPLSLPRGYVDDLRSRVGELGRLDAAEEVTYDYARSQMIEVTSGPWVGQVGSYDYRKKGLAMLMMRMMGRQVTVPVPLANTRPLARTAGAC